MTMHNVYKASSAHSTMKAIITAAGKGTRLEHLTKSTNKCIIDIDNKPLMHYSLEALSKAGIKDIFVAVGYCADIVEEVIKGKATPIYNPFYSVSGILISLWIAKDKLYNQPFIFATGDLYFDPEILQKCIQQEGDVVMVINKKVCDEEDAKAQVKGKIIKLGKHLPVSTAAGEYIGMTKFSAEGSRLFFDEMDTYLREGGINGYVMTLVNRMIDKGFDVRPLMIENLRTKEIDYVSDLEHVRNDVHPEVKKKYSDS